MPEVPIACDIIMEFGWGTIVNLMFSHTRLVYRAAISVHCLS